jgi:hypothetical protein
MFYIQLEKGGFEMKAKKILIVVGVIFAAIVLFSLGFFSAYFWAPWV